MNDLHANSLKPSWLNSPKFQSLERKLVVVWIAGFIYGGATFLLAVVIAFRNFEFIARPSLSVFVTYITICLLIAFGSVSFIGAVFAKRWFGGLSSLVAIPIGYLIGIPIFLPFSLWGRLESLAWLFGDNPELRISFLAVIIISLVLLLTTKPSLTEGLVILGSLVFGCSLAMIGRKLLIPERVVVPLYAQIPQIVWTSVVFGFEFARGQRHRSGWVGFGLLLGVSFVWPILVSSLFR